MELEAAAADVPDELRHVRLHAVGGGEGWRGRSTGRPARQFRNGSQPDRRGRVLDRRCDGRVEGADGRPLGQTATACLRQPFVALSRCKLLLLFGRSIEPLLRAQIEMRVWAEAVFQSVHQQFSVPIYGGEYTRRGSNLDLAKIPLAASNMTYIAERLQTAKANPGVRAASIIEELCSHEAAPGGFYDDLGELGDQQHLVLKVNPVGQADCRGLADYTIVTVSPSSQYYDVPSSSGALTAGKKDHKSRAPPKLPANTTRQLLTYVEIRGDRGIRMAMRYPIVKAGSYVATVVTGGGHAEFSINGGRTVQAGELAKGKKTTVALPGTLSGTTEIQWFSNSTLEVYELWLTPAKE